MTDETLEPDERQELGRLGAFRGIIKDLTILVGLLITLCASIGGLVQGCKNGQGIQEHSQQLGEIKTAVDEKSAVIDKTANTVMDLKLGQVKKDKEP